MTRRASFGFIVLALSVLCVAGCGKSVVPAKGKVVNKGQPYSVSDKGLFQITLFADDGKTYATESKADGTFTVIGPDRKGAPPGKYHVSVEAMDPYQQKVDKLGGKFAGAKSPLSVEITSADKELVVDVGQ